MSDFSKVIDEVLGGEAESFPGWTPITGDDREAVLADLARHLEEPLPSGVALLGRHTGCYPTHDLIRIRLETPLGVRESYLLYAPGDPVPLDWTSAPIHDLNPRALEIEDEAAAAAYLRFFCFAIAGDEGRFFITERIDDLRLEPGVELDEATRALLEGALFGLRLEPPEADDGPGQYRFSAPILYGSGLFEATFLVDRQGNVVMVDDTPIVADLPVVEDELGSDRYFVLVRADMPGIPAHEFLERILAGTSMEEIRVLGNVHARGLLFEKPVDIRQVTFNGDAIFEGARFQAPVRFERCAFQAGLDLREARVGASFVGDRLSVGRNAVARPGGAASFQAGSLRVEGTLDLRGTRVRGGLDLRGAEIDGDLRLGGADLATWNPYPWETYPLDPPVALDLRGARIGGDLDFCDMEAGLALPASPTDLTEDASLPGFARARAIAHGTVLATRVEVAGRLALGGLRCHGNASFDLATLEGGVLVEANGGSRFLCRGTLGFSFSAIRGNVTLEAIHVEGDVELFMSHIDGSVFSRCYMSSSPHPAHAIVRGNFDVSGIETRDIELEGAELGSMRMITGDVGRFRLLPGLEPVIERKAVEAPDNARDAEPEKRATVIGWRLRPCRIGALLVQTANIRQAATFSNVHVESDGTGELDGLAELHQIECGGGIQFWTPRLFVQLTHVPGEGQWVGEPPDVYAIDSRFPKGLDLSGVSTRAELSLVNVKSGGLIRINDCKVGHDLDLGAHGPDPARREGQTKTRCHGLELEATVCEGDADLSGLEAARPDGAPGHVQARRLRVAGKLLFSRPLGPDRDEFDGLSEDPDRRVEATISGRLDLSAAEASHLVISGHSFQEDRPDRGISFERGRFRRFQVVYPFPARHDSSDLAVERWEIPDAHLLTFLEQSHPLRRSTYLGVERVLRNDGNDELADDVYRSLRRKVIKEARLEGSGPLRRLSFTARREVSRLLGLTIGWGTQNLKPLFVAALLFPLSLWVFSAPENIVPTTALIEVTPGLAEDATPTDQGFPWGVGDGAWMALRFQVPVIPILARERWEPGRDPLWLDLPGGGATAVPWISPEDYAYVIFLAHWVIWPLFLIGVTTKVIRERA